MADKREEMMQSGVIVEDGREMVRLEFRGNEVMEKSILYSKE